MRHTNNKLWHLALFVLLLCTGTQTAHATWADDEFGNNGNFNATVKDNNCLHFYLIYSADKGYNCWVNRNAYITVDRYSKDQSYIGTEEIFRYDGWEESSKVRVNLKKGAILFTNLKDGEKVLESPDTDWIVWTNKTGDKWVVELDWFPPQQWQKDGELLDVKIKVDYKDNDDGNKTKNINRLDKFNLNGKVPTFSLASTGFLSDFQHAAKGEVWSSKYTLSGKYYSVSTPEGIIQDKASETSGTFFNNASDKAREATYSMLFMRNENLKKDENRYWSLERTVKLPAYHRIHNFGYSKQSNTLIWKLLDTNQGDKVTDDAFYIESSTVPNFANAQKLAEFSFKVGTASAASHSRMDGSTQVFEYTLPEGHNGSFFRIRRKSAEKLGWNQEFASSTSSTNFISDLCVSVAGNSTEARNALLRQGYKLMDYNLNHGFKGAYVYLGYKETDNPLDAISRIGIKRNPEWAADKGATYTDGGYKMHPVPTLGYGAGNLTQDIEGGMNMYLYYSKDQVKGKGKSVITRIMHTGEKNILSSGYRYLGESLTADASDPSNSVNLNQSTTAAGEEIRLVCQMHEHTSDFYCRKESNGVYSGHDCCGVTLDSISTIYIKGMGDLDLFREFVKGGLTDINAELMTDIAVNDSVLVGGNLNPATGTFQAWEPIGNSEHPYGGTFDGHGHSIRGIYINGGSGNVGLFGTVKGASIRNLIVRDTYIKTGNGAGGIAGQVTIGQDSTLIDDCMFQGYIECNGDGGGIAGSTFDGKTHFRNCHTQGKIRNSNYSFSNGGIVGYAVTGGKVSYCLSEMEENCAYFFGISYHARSLTVKNSYCTIGSSGTNAFASTADMASGKVTFNLSDGNSNRHWGQELPADHKPFLIVTDSVKAKKNVAVYQELGTKCTTHDIMPTGNYSNTPFADIYTWHQGKAHHEAVTPTCTEKGNLEYWTCSTCNGIFGNEACTAQLMKVPEIEEIGHHDYDEFDVCIYCKQCRLDIEADDADAIESAPAHSHGTEQQYDLSGRRITGSQRGIIIQRDSQGKIRKVMK